MMCFARKAACAVMALAMTMTMTSCSTPGSSATSASPDDTAKTAVTVVSSIAQWGSLASAIAGDDVKVTSILSSDSVDPHDFEPTAKDVGRIRSASIVIVNGAGYDAWATKSASTTATIVSAAQTVGAMDGDNPHLWFSKDARSAMAEEVEEALAKAMPSKASAFSRRLDSWKKREAAVEKAVSAVKDEHDDATYAATEAVSYYLMSELGFKDKTPEGFSKAVANESEPSASDIRSFTSLISNSQIDLLIDNKQERGATARILIAAAKARSLPVVEVGEQMPQGSDDLLEWITDVVGDISAALDDDAQSEDKGSSSSSSSSSSSAATESSAKDAATR